MSELRIFGVVLGCLFLVYSIYSLRTYQRSVSPISLFLSGVALLLLSFFPQLLKGFSTLFAFNDMAYGKVMFLEVVLIAILWALSLRNANSTEFLASKLESMVRSLSRESTASWQVAPGQVWVLIPAFNEADNLPSVLERMPQEVNGVPVTVLVIDDGSSDDTSGQAMRHSALVVSHHTNVGGGAALKTGYEIAGKYEPLAIVTMDADGQHDPREIGKLVSPIINDSADLVIGSRVLGSSADYSRLRSSGVTFFSAFINLLAGSRITDCSSGYRAFSRELANQCRIEQSQYHTAEVIIEAAKHGLNIREVPIHIERRLSGKSKKGTNIFYALNFANVILRTWMR